MTNSPFVAQLDALQERFGSKYIQAVFKAVRLVATRKAGLLLAIPVYRIGWRLRGLDFGIVSVKKLGLDPDKSNYHKDGGGPLLRDLLDQLPITSSDAIVDFGAGKAGAMATMAQYPFRRVDGVEIAPELVEAARKNIAKLGLSRCSMFLQDATTFTTQLDDYSYVFMYNPFPAPVVAKVLANIEESLRRNPRKLTIVYGNPLHEDVVLASGTFTKTIHYQPYPGYVSAVYENR